MALLRTKYVARNEIVVHFPWVRGAQWPVGVKRHRNVETSGGSTSHFIIYHNDGCSVKDEYLGTSSAAPRVSQSPAGRLFGHQLPRKQAPGGCPKSRTRDVAGCRSRLSLGGGGRAGAMTDRAYPTGWWLEQALRLSCLASALLGISGHFWRRRKLTWPMKDAPRREKGCRATHHPDTPLHAGSVNGI